MKSHTKRMLILVLVVLLKVRDTCCFYSTVTPGRPRGQEGVTFSVVSLWNIFQLTTSTKRNRYINNRCVLLPASRRVNPDEKNEANRVPLRSKTRNQRKHDNIYAYRLPKDYHAWNIDGSGRHRPIFDDKNSFHTYSYSYRSWMSFWEWQIGSRGKTTTCSYSDCNIVADIGGHVWLKGKGPHIAPICKRCNSVITRIECNVMMARKVQQLEKELLLYA